MALEKTTEATSFWLPKVHGTEISLSAEVIPVPEARDSAEGTMPRII